MLIYVGAHCKKCNLLARNIDPLTSQGHVRWTVAQTDWNFHPPLKLANSLLTQQPVNPHFICMATFKKKRLLQSVGLPPSQRKSFGRANLSVNQREKDLPQRERTPHSVKGPWIRRPAFWHVWNFPLAHFFLGWKHFEELENVGNVFWCATNVRLWT